MTGDPFVDHGMAYWHAGWHGVLRLPVGEKYPPPFGETGPGAPYLSRADLGGLLAEHASGAPVKGCLPTRRIAEGRRVRLDCRGVHSIGLRLPDDVIALDVDAYKGAASELARLEERLGALPATWRNSARFASDDVSGHRFYRVPAGRTWKGEACRGVEILQAGHRYAVVWPSTNPDHEGRPYRWMHPGGEVVDEIPPVDDLPPLPEAWVAHLAKRDRVKARTMSERETTAWEAALRTVEHAFTCDVVKGTLRRYEARLADNARSRHDTGMTATHALMCLGGEGHAGVPEALDAFEARFIEAVTRKGKGVARTRRSAEDEYSRLHEGAVREAATREAMPREGCDCPSFEGLSAWRGGEGSGPGANAGPPPIAGHAAPGPVGDPADLSERWDAAPRASSASAIPAAEAAGTRADSPGAASVHATADEMPPLDVRRKAPQFYGATQDGMAQAVVDYFGSEMRFVPDGRHSWYVWDGSVWRLDLREAHRERVKHLMRALPGGDKDEDQKEWKAFRRSMLSAAGIASIARLAQSDPRVATLTTQLDAEPRALNTPAGIIDLETSRTHEHDAAMMCTRVTTVVPDRRGERRRWDAFLAETFPDESGGPDHELIAYVQRLLGYSATGLSVEHVLPFCHGSGGNGKGVLLDTVGTLLGMDDATGYALTTANTFLMARQNPAHRTEIASLMGRRFVVTSEVNRGDRLDEGRVKNLTGEKYVRANFMHHDEFSFPTVHTLWLQGNEEPEAATGGRSLMRRLRLIPFVHEVPEDRIERGLVDRLVRECGPAILAWIVDGARAYFDQGLDPTPSAVLVATAQYAADQDHLGRFLDEMTHRPDSDYARGALRIRARDLFEAYERWCDVERVPAFRRLDPTHLGRKLKSAHKIESRRAASGMEYLGIALRSDDSEPNF